MAKIKLKAATIVEALVSLVVIAMAFSVSILIYVNVVKTGNEREKLHALITLRNTAIGIKQSGSYDAGEVELENGRIIKNITGYKAFENAYLLELYYLNASGDTINKYREIIEVLE